MSEDKLVAISERVASTDGESESDSGDDLIYYESGTSDYSNSYYGELDGAEPPVQKTRKTKKRQEVSGRKTGHWSRPIRRFWDLVG